MEMEYRVQSSSKLLPSVISTLMRVMESNPYAKFFHSLKDQHIIDISRIVIRSDPNHDQRTHNAPVASQVAAIWVEDGGSSQPLTHDIIVRPHSGSSQRFQWSSTSTEISTFPINEVLVQTIDDLVEAEEQVAQSSSSNRKVSCREYYCYQFQIRIGQTSLLLRCGRLLQQFIVDMYIKIEMTRLDFIRCNQDTIRAELYQGIIDSLHLGETEGSNIGRPFILPPSFIGGPRDMRRRYLDAMALVRRYGKPDFFITMTCNPQWPEIKRELLPHEEVQNRPDLISRVFRAKLTKLKKDIVEGKLFGNVATFVYVVEFQKRGLPHAHFLIILDSKSKIRSMDQYDAYVCAEIPDRSLNPHIHEAVLKHMMHGPCGRDNPKNVCMRDDSCKNKYPRNFAEITTNRRNSFPIYRRRDDGRQARIRGVLLDNRWVIPYNPFLLAKYDRHINVEICSTIKAVKYLYKYIYKGHDRVLFAVTNATNTNRADEISAYQSARWISPPEAAWRIFRFLLNDIYPNIVALQIHLPSMQTVTYRSEERLEDIAENNSRRRTMLTAFFERNRTDRNSRLLLYEQFPEHYVWNPKKNERFWSPRQRGFAIGRVIYANPVEGERYYLRLLLTHIRGPQSFEDLLIVNTTKCSTFREAAYRRDFLKLMIP
ncbi:uncharacterized protein LOC125492930 [Beta vulgaris subsp. vulgaris]|uniref:uncharacterized protein LOC125492930 n=1 Tax=Beta vulgaris subsp. vulgaris TaxID=3555 RepID=UPI002546B161|nr:uncharacterized protein LOC125492930 [Beta vulgaris subsp. vulgaris]